MREHELSFAKVVFLSESISEVIVNDGVEIDLQMVDEYHECLLSNLRSPFSLLINKLHSYTYTFDAQRKLGTLDEINAMAVVSHRMVSTASTEALANSVPREKDWNLRIFSERDQALDWLTFEQNKLVEIN